MTGVSQSTQCIHVLVWDRHQEMKEKEKELAITSRDSFTQNVSHLTSCPRPVIQLCRLLFVPSTSSFYTFLEDWLE